MTFLDHFEETEIWKPLGFSGADYPGAPAYSISTFANLCKLSVIMNDILNEVYAERNTGRTARSTNRKTLRVELEQWYNELPIHLKYDPSNGDTIVPPPHVLSLL